MSAVKKEYHIKSDLKENTGYTLKEAKRKCAELKESLLNGKTAYTGVYYENDPRGGYRVVAEYKPGIHYYDRNGNIKGTIPIRDR